MALSIKDPTADKLARELADITGRSITQVIVEALSEKKERLSFTDAESHKRYEALRQIATHCASLTVYDDRGADEILGYDENGLPG